MELVRQGMTITGAIGVSILQILQDHDVSVESSCGGHGACGKCRIRFVDRAPEPSSADLSHVDCAEIAAGWRLACAHDLQGPTRLEVRSPDGELDHKAARGADVGVFAVDPMVQAREVRLDWPSPGDRRTLVDRLRGAVGDDVRIPLPRIRQLSTLPWSSRPLTVVEAAGELVDVTTGEPAGVHGLAIDVGTTTLAAYLFGLGSGEPLGVAASRNPQRRFGADVIARISHVRREKATGLADLRAAVIGGVNELIERLRNDASIPAESIYAATVVGNPTMMHLFLGVDPTGIDVSPYVPVFGDTVRCRAGDVDLAMHPFGVVETLPAISAYVGADIVAGILASGLHEHGPATLFLDIGTNGEIVLRSGDRLIACSTAAGPAFEGASIVEGMAALSGAIEAVRIDSGRIECEVIGNAVPRGLCGTGLVSAVAELRSAGLIDSSGRFSDAGLRLLSRRFEGEGNRRRFRLTDGTAGVCLYQSDVREFQLAKAAVRSGIEVLLCHAGVGLREIQRVLIGGAFSHRLSAEHLIATGFLPAIDPSQVHVVGDTAGQGAKQVLLDRRLMEVARRVAGRVEYVELSADDRFRELYVEQMSFPDP